MDGYKNNIEVRGGLILDFRLNNNRCIEIFNSISHNKYDGLDWESITFISDEQETIYWKTFHEEIRESINKKLHGVWIELEDEIYNEMWGLCMEYRQNEWLWLIRDNILSQLDGNKINIIETFGENSAEAKKYRVGNFE